MRRRNTIRINGRLYEAIEDGMNSEVLEDVRDIIEELRETYRDIKTRADSDKQLKSLFDDADASLEALYSYLQKN